MTLKNKIASVLLILSTTVFAQQETAISDTIIKKETKISFLDSLKSTFVKDEIATCIDSLWMQDLTSLDVYDNMLQDIKTINTDQTVDFELPTELLKERLKKLDEKSPFHIEYNIGLENVIKSFLKNRKKGFERLMGISQYYFPLFEEQLAKNNIPLEIKYLAVVESALNPRAVSRVGATGLWQFMYQTGKQYGLKIDSYEDERSNPLKSSEAASTYMNNMYKIFGDWDLVLASYNSGPGNVAKAIRRSGGQQNFWNIKKYLPKETQGYLPAFLATMYIFEYHKEHGIVPNKAVANRFATDTVAVKQHLTFKQISDLFDISVAEIQFFNPSYKRNEIPYVTGELNFLTLPKDKIAVFTSNEDKVYAYAKYQENLREKPFIQSAVAKAKDTVVSDGTIVSNTKYHKVKRGENLSIISSKYGVALSDLKRWNGLQSNIAPLGRNLKIYSFEKIEKKPDTSNTDIAQAETEKEVEKNTEKQPEVIAVRETKQDKKFYSEKVVTYKDVTKIHKVAKGDNLTEIATKYQVSINDLKKWNQLADNNVKIGQNIKIIKNEKVISTIRKELNPVAEKSEDVAVAEKTSTKETVSDNNNATEDGFYVVQKGDNLFSIANKYDVTMQQIKDWNNLTDTNIKLGSKLIVNGQHKETTRPDVVIANEKYYSVKPGDTLYSISKKFPGVTIADIQKWNNIKSEEIKPGMKLKIGG
jgi:membrane-bound lytic murein transglycosylase D